MPEQSPYRWIVVFAAVPILALAMGSIVNGMSVYIIPFENEYGWSRTGISLINVIGIIGLSLGGLLMGPLADRLGTRPVVLFGSVFVAVSYLLAALATELWQLYSLMFIAGFLGAAAIAAPVMAALGNWFSKGAGLAIGIAAAGQALGQGGVPFLSSLLIESVGPNASLGFTGAAMLLIMVPLALLFKAPPSLTNDSIASAQTEGRDFLKFSSLVPLMCVATFLCCTCMSVPLMHLVPLMRDGGHSPDEASGVIFIMLMVAITGRIAFGKLADMIGGLPAYMCATAWMTLFVYGFTLIDSVSGITTYAIIYGFGYGGVMTGVIVTMATLTEPRRRASALAIVTMFAYFGHANGGFIGGYLFDVTGDYKITYAIAAIAGIVNLIIVGCYYLKSRAQLESRVRA